MNDIEFVEFQDKLKEVYNFKFDIDILREVIINYSLKDCFNAYKSIVSNSLRLTSLNIISELKNELLGVKPEYIEKVFKNCDSCSNSGLITMLDSEKRKYTFACNCQKGKEKHKHLKLNMWLGCFDQFENKVQYILES